MEVEAAAGLRRGRGSAALSAGRMLCGILRDAQRRGIQRREVEILGREASGGKTKAKSEGAEVARELGSRNVEL